MPPETVRRTLKLGKRDKIYYTIRDGVVVLTRKMLESGQPPDDWDQIFAAARAESDRLQKLVAQDYSGEALKF